MQVRIHEAAANIQLLALEVNSEAKYAPNEIENRKILCICFKKQLCLQL